MPIAVVCSHCGHRAGAKDEWAGKRLKCPACGNLVTVPGPAPGAPSTTAPASQGAPRVAAPSAPQTRQPPATDLFGGVGAATDPFAGAAAAPLAPALGSAPVRPRKSSNSTKTVLIVLAVVGGVMLLGCAGLVALLVPAIQQARERARANIAAGGGAPQIPPALPANLPIWSADPALAAQLGDEVTFDRYAMRIPKGYAASPSPPSTAPPGVRLQQWFWAGMSSPQSNGAVVIAAIAQAEVGTRIGTLDQELTGYLKGIEQSAAGTKVQVRAKEHGTLLGKQFGRVRYTLLQPNSAAIQGVAYLGVDANRTIAVQFLSSDAEGSDGYRLLDTSLLTVREK